MQVGRGKAFSDVTGARGSLRRCAAMTFKQSRFGSALLILTGCAALALTCGPAQAQDHRLPATVRAELTALYEGLDSASYDLFAHREETAYRDFLRELIQSVDRPQSRQETAILLQRLAAYGRIGHARIDAPIEVLWRSWLLADVCFRCLSVSMTAACC
jgi:hypothetical protein